MWEFFLKYNKENLYRVKIPNTLRKYHKTGKHDNQGELMIVKDW